jgi:CDP-glucose 4,6-dehydratase
VETLARRALPQASFWTGKRVFLTGHTGFKGGWLSLWLHKLGARTRGYALTPDTLPNFFSVCRVTEKIEHQRGDVRDSAALGAAMAAFQPDIVFHLAAQPLVRASYAQPVETFSTNVMGTVNVLEAARQIPSVAVLIIVTSDKVYAESTQVRHAESGRFGGADPYSASKACAELVTASFPLPPAMKAATVRAGNVIGGGDWAADRLLPDFFRSILAQKTLKLRNPQAVRPWQHVLDPLCGYLLSAEHLWAANPPRRDTWNFGPVGSSEITVAEVAGTLCRLWGDTATYEIETQSGGLHEAPVLRLNSHKAAQELQWQPGWELAQALSATVDWFRAFQDNHDMDSFTQSQIEAYGKS